MKKTIREPNVFVITNQASIWRTCYIEKEKDVFKYKLIVLLILIAI
jgi:hypothetical protein